MTAVEPLKTVEISGEELQVSSASNPLIAAIKIPPSPTIQTTEAKELKTERQVTGIETVPLTLTLKKPAGMDRKVQRQVTGIETGKVHIFKDSKKITGIETPKNDKFETQENSKIQEDTHAKLEVIDLSKTPEKRLKKSSSSTSVPFVPIHQSLASTPPPPTKKANDAPATTSILNPQEFTSKAKVSSNVTIQVVKPHRLSSNSINPTVHDQASFSPSKAKSTDSKIGLATFDFEAKYVIQMARLENVEKENGRLRKENKLLREILSAQSPYPNEGMSSGVISPAPASHVTKSIYRSAVYRCRWVECEERCSSKTDLENHVKSVHLISITK